MQLASSSLLCLKLQNTDAAQNDVQKTELWEASGGKENARSPEKEAQAKRQTMSSVFARLIQMQGLMEI